MINDLRGSPGNNYRDGSKAGRASRVRLPLRSGSCEEVTEDIYLSKQDLWKLSVTNLKLKNHGYLAAPLKSALGRYRA